ncbi:hypothetical protein M0E87_08365 [Corynebacterium sp. CCM 9185]|uniref:Uncharacterized protein n=1 Tax=Corynebacterium marambiense TaxID=2765364 RepID=A0ABS0VU79_9CORY|nr:hypothetical protein [Corynebacterium marambiense]MBI9000317.1 hypothetical protein [Corynebacterium marambiense]MCK7663670.1 hypothetical protein [Corynebacterium marambiense]
MTIGLFCTRTELDHVKTLLREAGAWRLRAERFIPFDADRLHIGYIGSDSDDAIWKETRERHLADDRELGRIEREFFVLVPGDTPVNLQGVGGDSGSAAAANRYEETSALVFACLQRSVSVSGDDGGPGDTVPSCDLLISAATPCPAAEPSGSRLSEY